MENISEIKKSVVEMEVDYLIRKQRLKGRLKYGTSGLQVDEPDNTIYWIDNAIEEGIDLVQYLVTLKMRLLKK